MDETIDVNQNALHSRSHYYNGLIINHRYCFTFLKIWICETETFLKDLCSFDELEITWNLDSLC